MSHWKTKECFKKNKFVILKQEDVLILQKKQSKKDYIKKNKKTNKQIIETFEDVRSYSPTINKETERLSITPHIDLMASVRMMKFMFLILIHKKILKQECNW